MIRFLFDEDVTPRLRDVANARGYEALVNCVVGVSEAGEVEAVPIP